MAAKISPEEAREIYREGRKTHVNSLGVFSKIFYFLLKHNVVPYIIVGIIAYSVFFSVVRPFFNGSDTSGNWKKITKKHKIFDNEPIPSGTKVKIGVKTLKKEDGEFVTKDVNVYVDGNYDVHTEASEDTEITVVSKMQRIDFRFQPGLGVVGVPRFKNRTEIFEPAFVLSPVEFYNTVDIDALFTQNRIGLGLSTKIPSRYTNNTYIGGGASFDYDTSDRAFILYAKINF